MSPRWPIINYASGRGALTSLTPFPMGKKEEEHRKDLFSIEDGNISGD